MRTLKPGISLSRHRSPAGTPWAPFRLWPFLGGWGQVSPTGGRVAREMFRFSKTGLSNWLTNPVLQGHVAYLRKSNSPIIQYDRHQPLITSAEAQEIESILQLNRSHRGYSGKMKYPLSGLVVCGECRSTCYTTTGCNNTHRLDSLPGFKIAKLAPLKPLIHTSMQASRLSIWPRLL